MEQQVASGYESWAILELFGHTVIAGFVSEETMFGAKLLRIDVPTVDEQHPGFTKYYGGAAIYGMTPTTEAHARAAAAQIRVRPVTLYVLPEPKRLAAPVAEYPRDDRFDDDDDDDDDDEEPRQEDVPF